MGSYSEVLKQVHICTESCKHQAQLPKTKTPKTRQKPLKNKDEFEEDAWNYPVEYYGGSLEENIQKNRKLIHVPNRISKSRRVTTDVDFVIPVKKIKPKMTQSYSKVRRVDKTDKSDINRVNQFEEDVWIFAHDFSSSICAVKNHYQFLKGESFFDEFLSASSTPDNKIIYKRVHENYQELNTKGMYEIYDKKAAESDSIAEWIIKKLLLHKTVILIPILEDETDQFILTCKPHVTENRILEKFTLVSIEVRTNESVKITFIKNKYCKITIESNPIEETKDIL